MSSCTVSLDSDQTLIRLIISLASRLVVSVKVVILVLDADTHWQMPTRDHAGTFPRTSIEYHIHTLAFPVDFDRRGHPRGLVFQLWLSTKIPFKLSVLRLATGIYQANHRRPLSS